MSNLDGLRERPPAAKLGSSLTLGGRPDIGAPGPAAKQPAPWRKDGEGPTLISTVADDPYSVTTWQAEGEKWKRLTGSEGSVTKTFKIDDNKFKLK